jgi:hypothetical protein
MFAFAPKKIKFSIGFKMDEWTFVSEEYDIENRYEKQVFKIAPRFVVGSILKIDLIGKIQQDPTDKFYYTKLQNVKCFGMPICFAHSKDSLLLKLVLKWIVMYHHDYLQTLGINRSNMSAMRFTLYYRERSFVRQTLRHVRHKKKWMQSVANSGYFLNDQWKIPVSCIYLNNLLEFRERIVCCCIGLFY